MGSPAVTSSWADAVGFPRSSSVRGMFGGSVVGSRQSPPVIWTRTNEAIPQISGNRLAFSRTELR
jgi:hypothetical protein